MCDEKKRPSHVIMGVDKALEGLEAPGSATKMLLSSTPPSITILLTQLVSLLVVY